MVTQFNISDVDRGNSLFWRSSPTAVADTSLDAKYNHFYPENCLLIWTDGAHQPTVRAHVDTENEWRNLPVCLPFLLASFLRLTLARECTTVGFLKISPSRLRRAMLRREFAREISLISLGSSQILFSPHLRTDAARRFWSLRDTVTG